MGQTGRAVLQHPCDPLDSIVACILSSRNRNRHPNPTRHTAASQPAKVAKVLRDHRTCLARGLCPQVQAGTPLVKFKQHPHRNSGRESSKTSKSNGEFLSSKPSQHGQCVSLVPLEVLELEEFGNLAHGSFQILSTFGRSSRLSRRALKSASSSSVSTARTKSVRPLQVAPGTAPEAPHPRHPRHPGLADTAAAAPRICGRGSLRGTERCGKSLDQSLKPFQAYNQCHSRLGLSLTSSCQRCPIEVLLHRDKERSACRDIVRMQPVKTCAACACVLYTDMRRTRDHSHFTASYIYIYLFICLFMYVCIYLFIYIIYIHT